MPSLAVSVCQVCCREANTEWQHTQNWHRSGSMNSLLAFSKCNHHRLIFCNNTFKMSFNASTMLVNIFVSTQNKTKIKPASQQMNKITSSPLKKKNRCSFQTSFSAEVKWPKFWISEQNRHIITVMILMRKITSWIMTYGTRNKIRLSLTFCHLS